MPESFIKSNGDEFITAMKGQITQNMTEVAETYRARLRETLDTPPARTGRIYKYIKGKLYHQASAPGEPPAPLSRNLLESLYIHLTGDDSGRIASFVYTDVEYALALEYGRYDSRHPIQPRPAWYPTFLEHKEGLGNIATQGFHRRGWTG